MVSIVSKELHFDEELKKKIEFICDFCNTNFKIANATIHFDESSPHLSIVGVPFKDGMKNGMEKTSW